MVQPSSSAPIESSRAIPRISPLDFISSFPFQMQISKTSVWGEGSEGFRKRLSLGQSILQERFVIDFPHILHGRADKVVFSNAEEGAQGAPVLAAAVGFQ